MKVVVTSQNFRTVTPHAGRTRRFLVYEAEADGEPVEAGRLDLPKEMSLHDFHGDGEHPLDAMDVLIVGSCGEGFVRRLARRGVRVVQSEETDPAAAVRSVLARGIDTAGAARACGCGAGGHEIGRRRRMHGPKRRPLIGS